MGIFDIFKQKPKFVSPGELAGRTARDYRRAARRTVKGRGALAHATGVGFAPDESTTKAVLKRMAGMEWYLRNETPPWVTK